MGITGAYLYMYWIIIINFLITSISFTLLVFSWIDKAGFFSGIKDDVDDDGDDVDDFKDDSSDLRFKFDEVELVCDVILSELAWWCCFESPSFTLFPK